MFHAEFFGNGGRDHAVGGSDDHQGVAGFTVFGQQGMGLGQHQAINAVAHEFAVPLIQLRHVMAAKDFHAEIKVGGVVQLAGQVVLIERVVARLVGVAVENAPAAQVIAPGVIAVTAQKGVVQVE